MNTIQAFRFNNARGEAAENREKRYTEHTESLCRKRESYDIQNTTERATPRALVRKSCVRGSPDSLPWSGPLLR